MKRKSMRRVFERGGQMTSTNVGMFGAIAGLGSGVLDGLSTGQGAPSLGLAGAKGALSGVAAGAQFGPVGMAVGGGLGLATGLITGSAARQEEKRNKSMMANQLYRDQLNMSQATLAGDPTLASGNRNVSYYALGGMLGTEKNAMNGMAQYGGTLQPTSSTTTEVVGPEHEQGGVDIPQMGAELEGGETTAGPRVFSEELGFAQKHKPIARAKGKIEKKAPTQERINALQRLGEKEDMLYQQQETLKQYLNL